MIIWVLTSLMNCTLFDFPYAHLKIPVFWISTLGVTEIENISSDVMLLIPHLPPLIFALGKFNLIILMNLFMFL